MIQDGVEPFEKAFMPYLMLPNKQTVAEWLTPRLEEANRTAELPDPFKMLGPAS